MCLVRAAMLFTVAWMSSLISAVGIHIAIGISPFLTLITTLTLTYLLSMIFLNIALLIKKSGHADVCAVRADDLPAIIADIKREQPTFMWGAATAAMQCKCSDPVQAPTSTRSARRG